MSSWFGANTHRSADTAVSPSFTTDDSQRIQSSNVQGNVLNQKSSNNGFFQYYNSSGLPSHAAISELSRTNQQKQQNISDLLQVLYPNHIASKNNCTTQSASSASSTGFLAKYTSRFASNSSSSSIAHRSITSTSSSILKTRFSQLLLEYGEKPIQDWAVIGYSTPVSSSSGENNHHNQRKKHGSVRSVNDHERRIKQPQVPNAGSKNKKPITWMQSPEYNSRRKKDESLVRNESKIVNVMNTTSIRDGMTSGAKYNKTSSSANSAFIGGSYELIDNNSHDSSTLQMNNINGRLYLCTRSIVFEPNDTSRGLIRCPFSKLDGYPTQVFIDDISGSVTNYIDNNTRNASRIVQIISRKHFVMKKDNVIGPYRQVTIHCQFRFAFLHSQPDQFLELSQSLFDVCSHQRSSTSSMRYPNATTPRSVATGKLLHHHPYSFDRSNFVDVREQIQTTNAIPCSIVSPLQSQCGLLVVTNEMIYFQLHQHHQVIATENQNQQQSQESLRSSGAVVRWNLKSIVAVARRYNGLRDSALEIYFRDDNGPGTINDTSSRVGQRKSNRTGSGTSILFAFERRHDRELILSCLQLLYTGRFGATNVNDGRDDEQNQLPCFTDRKFVIKVLKEWRKGTISNFEYLLALNTAAGRTFHDLSRYPVFPWVIQDYTSSQIDLTKESTFRDLSKPIGALNPERLQYFQMRMQSMSDMYDGTNNNDNNSNYGTNDGNHASDVTAFLYGTHYSAPAYVLYFLVRSMPEHMLCLQNGKFDSPDRLFHSLPTCYSSALANHADVKELIPEFYNPYLDYDFLINTRGLQFGATQSGDRVDDVVLPPWAISAREFIKTNIAALESEICTMKLPSWIDLIFGYKSRGPAALEANNVFHQFAYLGPNDLASMQTDTDRETAELQATEFGIVPDQLFIQSHPLRGDNDYNKIDELVASNLCHSLNHNTRDDPNNREAWELLDAHSVGINDAEFASSATGKGKDDNLINSGTRMNANSRDDNDRLVQTTSVESSQVSSQGILATNSMLTNASEDMTTWKTDIQRFSWEMEVLERKKVHNDAVTGCLLSLDDESDTKQSILTTTSLDGSLKVLSLSFPPSSSVKEEKNLADALTSTLSRYSTIIRQGPLGPANIQAALSKATISDYRAHSCRDPLGCLALTKDGRGGAVAFAGGHDDAILAYGIKSACAVASIYSHRDAVTGLCIIERTPFDVDCAIWCENSTHILISGSWDASVKVWSVIISSGETVVVNREPVAELFDADSPIVCVSSVSTILTNTNGSTVRHNSSGDETDDDDDDNENDNDSSEGIVVAAGCADGSFCIWNIHGDGVQVLLHKEPTRQGSGPCSVVKWMIENRQLHLFVGFGTGKIASYTIISGKAKRDSAVAIGSPVLSIAYITGMLLVGCADGGLRLLSTTNVSNTSIVAIDTKARPVLWNNLHNSTASSSPPGVSSICISYKTNDDNAAFKSYSMTGQIHRIICCSGAEDGTVVLFELTQVPT